MVDVTFLRRRLLEAVPTLFGLSVLIFLLTRVLPGDPVKLMLGPGATQEQIRQLRRELGFDQPLYVQYVDWLAGFLQGDWGYSIVTNQNVFEDIALRLPATFELVVVGLAIAVVVATPLGVIAGMSKDRWPDHVSRVGALIGISMPAFWIGILFQISLGLHFGLFPISGRLTSTVPAPPAVTHMYLVDSLIAGQLGTFTNALHHIFLPAITLALASIAEIMRLIRSEVIDISRKEYIMASRIYGLPSVLIQFKYVLKNSFSSSLTVIGLTFALLLGNAFVVEIVFAWPGMARYAIRAIGARDFNAVVAVVMVTGASYVFINLVVDLLYGYLDPRIRLRD